MVFKLLSSLLFSMVTVSRNISLFIAFC